jgi:arylsulfatase
VHEGGISTPLIARWPARFRASRRFIDTPSHFIDIMATCVEAGGASYPAGDAMPLEGRSLLPVIAGRSAPERSMFWEHEGNCAMRRGKWKLVRKFSGEWELYDIDKDRTELHDLASSRPEVAREMSAAWDQWATRCGVRPWAEVSQKLVDR